MGHATKFEDFFTKPDKQYSTSIAGTQKNQLEEAIFEALEGIRKDLELSQSHFSNIIHVAPGTYSTWKDNGRINLSKNLTLNDIGILKFIDLYDAITSLFAERSDYIEWFNNPIFDNRSPLKSMEDDPAAVLDLNRYTNWLINP
ncbi:hypothetical protein N9O57_00145 [bacterium]|nr:hypothetical protein [bacterium]